MTDETKAIINKEARDYEYQHNFEGAYHAYIAGASTWAERVEQLTEEREEGIVAFLSKLPPDGRDEEISALKEKLENLRVAAQRVCDTWLQSALMIALDDLQRVLNDIKPPRDFNP